MDTTKSSYLIVAFFQIFLVVLLSYKNDTCSLLEVPPMQKYMK